MDVFIKKINATVAVDWTAIPPDVQQHLIEYGVRQKLADSLSDMAVAKGHTVEEMAFAINELIARLYEGELGSRGRTADPVAQRAAGYHRFIDENGNRFGSFLVYHVNQAAATNDYPVGWYWVSQFPGCLPDGDPEGPFPSAAYAHDHAIDF